MSDIGLTWSATEGAADVALSENDIATDGGLETAVFLSLFTDARAEDSDELPTGETSRRGWWGDAFPTVTGDRWGSRLWLLARSKRTVETLRRAEQYAREALAWLLVDKVASRVDVMAEAVGGDMLGFSVAVYRPTGDIVQYRYEYNWASQEARRSV